MSASHLPHSFVLADVFHVESMVLEVPDHVYEDDPLLDWVACPQCDGEGWLECYGSAWGGAALAFNRLDLNFTLKPCSRCHCEGEVLDFVPAEPKPDVTFSLPDRLAA